MQPALVMVLSMLIGAVVTPVAARAHYVTKNDTRRNVYWFVMVMGISTVLTPLVVSPFSFSWNHALQFLTHMALILLAVYAGAVYFRHERAAQAGGQRAAIYEKQWEGIALATGFMAFATVTGYLVVYPLY